MNACCHGQVTLTLILPCGLRRMPFQFTENKRIVKVPWGQRMTSWFQYAIHVPDSCLWGNARSTHLSKVPAVAHRRL